MMNSRIIIGSRRSASVPLSKTVAQPIPRRIPNEFYPTPPEATRALLSVETFDGSIWEPACGEGAIAKELSAAGNPVVATDLVDYGFGISGVDFLKETRPRARHVVTNPPYGSGLADAFIEQALRFAHATRGTVAMLLNLSSLSHRRRTSWWKEKPPARLYAIDDIVCWPDHLYGPAPEYFTRHRYVWAVWTPDHRGPSAFWWLSAADFRGRRSSSNINERKQP
jgi:predicted RNA methylase